MEGRTASHRSHWWALGSGGVALAAAVAARTQLDAWLFGVLLLVAWGLLAYATRLLSIAKALRLLLVATALALAVVAWTYTAPQPRIRLEMVQLQRLPSSVQPGAVELVIGNSGTVSAEVTVYNAAYLAPVFRTAQALAASTMGAELSEMLRRAERVPPTGTLAIEPGETLRVDLMIPASERAWYIGRGEATVLVTARVRYRDRVFVRERVFCHFMTPPSGQWRSCPFLNE